MGGSNPYIDSTTPQLPTRAYSITFLPEGKKIEVNPGDLPYARDGYPGSILEIALGHDVDIDHACGGVCACSTCHVILRAGADACNEPTDDELDQLDNAPGLEPESRLACQVVPNGSSDITVEVPSWNRNSVKE